MTVRLLAVAAALLLGTIGSAVAQDMLVAPDTSGCQTYAPYAWADVAAGSTWQATVDLSNCTSAKMGTFVYYGYMTQNNKTSYLTVGDGIVLKVENLGSGAEYAPDAGTTKKSQPTVGLAVSQPTRFLLTAENTGRTTARIRMTWTRVGP